VKKGSEWETNPFGEVLLLQQAFSILGGNGGEKEAEALVATLRTQNHEEKPES